MPPAKSMPRLAPPKPICTIAIIPIMLTTIDAIRAIFFLPIKSIFVFLRTSIIY
ncbi:hypothetical protein MCHI_000759 [Candidatus Magnetoovum chiemensis]|nr:hypothetical protein MCHI_000759 [Candidatus Magnetoovum chiemensis]